MNISSENLRLVSVRGLDTSLECRIHVFITGYTGNFFPILEKYGIFDSGKSSFNIINLVFVVVGPKSLFKMDQLRHVGHKL